MSDPVQLPAPAYSERALRRWRDENLTVRSGPSGEIEALFRLEGSTCGNVPFLLEYTVRLSGASANPLILGLACAPASADTNHLEMCAAKSERGRSIRTLLQAPPLVGQTLDSAVAWTPSVAPAGCLCDEPARWHKWRAVLHTIHYALNSTSASSRS